MMKRFRDQVLGLLFLGISGATLAADAPVFLIETIRVAESGRVSREIVLSESRLQEGLRYSEEDLRDALARIHRLPFVWRANFALEKGSHRGAYRLVVTVVPVTTFFVNHIAGIHSYRDQVTLRERGRTFYEQSAGVGGRWFVGSRGVFFAGIGGREYSDAEIGYSQYNLFGTGGFASASLRYAHAGNFIIFPFLADSSSTGWEAKDSFAGRLLLGLPVGGNHALQARFLHVQGDVRESRDVLGSAEIERYENSGRLSFQETNLVWLYDTTNDAFFPSEGVTVAAGPGVFFGRTPRLFRIGVRGPGTAPTPPPPEPPREPQDTVSLYTSLSATRYLELSPRHSVSAGLGGSAGVSDVNDLGFHGTWKAFAAAKHSASLWGEERTGRSGDFRIETGADYTIERASAATPSFYQSLETMRFHSALVFRNRWALFRLRLTYTAFQRAKE